MKKNFLFLSVLLACSLTGFAQNDAKIISLSPALYYSFENAEDLTASAVGGTPLEFWQRGGNNTIGTPDAPAPALTNGPTANKKAVYITPELNLKLVNPQITEGGLLNYAIVIDFKVSVLGRWNAFFQSVMNNNVDAYLYLAENGTVGKRTYGGYVSPNEWHRLVLNAGNENSVWSYKVYIDSYLAADMSGSVSGAEVGLKDFFWLFTTNESQYDFDWSCAGIALFTKTLTETEIISLGSRTSPYLEGGVQIAPNTVIEAEYFDKGGLGTAYNVASPIDGSANSIRQDEQISIKDGDYGDYVSVQNGDWLKYTVDVTEERAYDLLFNLATSTQGSVTIYIDNATTGNSADFDATGEAGDLVWSSVTTVSGIRLPAGEHVLKIVFSTSGEAQIHFADIFIEEAPNLVALDRSIWQIREYSSERPYDGQCHNAILDGDFGSYWHQNYASSSRLGCWDAPLPHWHIIDLGSVQELYKFEIWRRLGNNDLKTVQIYISDDPDPDADSWVLVGESNKAGQPITVEVSKANRELTKGRYLKIFMPDSNRNLNVSITEFLAFGIEAPYTGTAYDSGEGIQTIPGTVEAEYFDNGGLGLAYFVSPEAGGSANTIRQDEKISIEYGDYENNISVTGGAWLKYTVNVEEEKDYNVYFTLFTDTATMRFSVDGQAYGIYPIIEGGPAAAAGIIINKQDYADWITNISIEGIPLTAGEHVITVGLFSPTEIKLADMFIGERGTVYYPFTKVVQAEDYDEDGLSHKKEPGPGAGYNMQFTSADEVLNYTIEVPVTAKYEFDFTCSSQYWISGDFPVSIDGGEFITYVIDPGTEGYYTTRTFFEVDLTAGTHLITVGYTRGWFDKFAYKTQSDLVAIKPIEAANAKVYTADGALYLNGFSNNVSLNIYNLVGQKVAGYAAVSGSVPVSLAKGVYIVTVTDKGKSVSSKVIIK
jgi:hypothetical protein